MPNHLTECLNLWRQRLYFPSGDFDLVEVIRGKSNLTCILSLGKRCISEAQKRAFVALLTLICKPTFSKRLHPRRFTGFLFEFEMKLKLMGCYLCLCKLISYP